MKRFVVVVAAAVLLATGASAQTKPAAPAAAMSDHAKKDVARHRAMAAAHEAAARCLESGKNEEVCQKELQEACKGLAIGKYCGMRHEH
jgi:Ni/Co efflux regulator RcnB